jgi:transcriptional coactivator HFI1/ADA1
LELIHARLVITLHSSPADTTCWEYEGRLSDEELIEEIGRFIKGPKVRLHNNLLSVLISNITRDTPAAEVAGWVSASDKPSSGSKLPVGDLNERKLKKEVMAISARERRRIKEVQEKVGGSPLHARGEERMI